MPDTTPSPPTSMMGPLVKLALPMVGITLLQVSMYFVDMAVCARLPAAGAQLAGLAISFQLLFLLQVAINGLLIGSVVMVARAKGAGDVARIETVTNQALTFVLAVSVVITLLGSVAAEPILVALGARGPVLAAALEYLRPLFYGVVFTYVCTLFGALFNGLRDTRTPFIAALVANALNAVLGIGLVLGKFGLPALGITGAALATVIASAFNAVQLFLALRRKAIPGLRFARWRDIDWGLARQVLKIGAPAALHLLVLNAHGLSMVAMIAHFDQISIAAHGVGIRVQTFVFLPGVAIMNTASAMIGRALGGGDAAQARRITRDAVVLSLVCMTALGGAAILAEGPIFAFLGVAADSTLGELSSDWIRIVGLGAIPAAVHVGYASALQGSGASGTNLLVTLAAVALQIPLAWVLGYHAGYGAHGVWMALLVSYVLRACFAALAYRLGRWAIVGVDAKQHGTGR